MNRSSFKLTLAVSGFALRHSFIASSLWLLTACSLAPQYQAPEVAAPVAFKEAGDWQTAVPADASARGAWWQAFGDLQLDQLEAQLQVSSQDLRAGLARYAQARALARQTRSQLFPRVDAGASVTRGQSSENTAGGGNVGNNFLASLDLSWEVDLLGRLRNAAAAEGERLRASAGDLASLQLSLQAELATNYFALRGADADIALLQDSITAFERAVQLTQKRYDGGIGAAQDVDQSQAQLESARAQLAAVRLERATYEHAIAVLLGQPAGAFTLAAAAFTGETPALDTGLPSALLQRRPDIAAAERRVAAANAEVGVARAAWFPVFTFGASGGYEAARSSDWFNSPSRFWSLGPGVTLPVLDGGTRSALNAGARAAYDESAANYRQTVLDAYREVEDSLAALHHLADELSSQQVAAAAAERALGHAHKRYTAGIASYLEVTSLQTTFLSAQRSALDARVRRINAAVTLVRALGGGWTGQQLDNPSQPAVAKAD